MNHSNSFVCQKFGDDFLTHKTRCSRYQYRSTVNCCHIRLRFSFIGSSIAYKLLSFQARDKTLPAYSNSQPHAARTHAEQKC